MASIEKDPASGNYRIRFRVGGRQFQRSLKTQSERRAEAIRGRVDEMIMLVEQGHVTIPPNADPGRFILSNGTSGQKLELPKDQTLKETIEAYFGSIPPGAKAARTIGGERIHVGHLLKHLGSNTPFRQLQIDDLQGYVKTRSGDTFRGKPISGGTIDKELTTFGLIWKFAVSRGYASGPCPALPVAVPRPQNRPPFKTWQQIESIIERGGLSKDEEAELWDCLFLDRQQVHDLLDYVKETAAHPFIYPMFAIAALAGARRAEILRSRLEDIDLDSGAILLRETKRDHRKAMTFRDVPLAPRLHDALKEWLAVHPGGQATITAPLKMARSKTRPVLVSLTVNQAVHHFKQALAESKWAKVRGYHVLRHSFASILASQNVHPTVIDRFMGHQTEEMRNRYRHLFPAERQAAIGAMSLNADALGGLLGERE